MSQANPEDPVKRQLDAYNAKDIELFDDHGWSNIVGSRMNRSDAEQFSENVRVYRPPNGEPVTQGKTDFKLVYTKRFESPGLHAQILNRTIVGNKVIDHEKVVGIAEEPVEVAVVYEVIDGLIHNVWFFAGQ
ncbi:MAG: steroid delta-isomerase [Algicola sp.]|nr:steroid delta-isomerase [Algicola sp.]